MVFCFSDRRISKRLALLPGTGILALGKGSKRSFGRLTYLALYVKVSSQDPIRDQ